MLVLSACAAAPRPPAGTIAPAGPTVRVPSAVPNGTVTAILPSGGFTAGGTATIPLLIDCRTGTIRGPLRAEILIAGLTGPSVHVRELAASPVTVAAGRQASASLTWDERDDEGKAVGPDDFTLDLVFETPEEAHVRVTLAVH